jgi:hypothetical protein
MVDEDTPRSEPLDIATREEPRPLCGVPRPSMATLAHHFEEGGWGMWPLLACSMVWLALSLERAA